MSENLLRADSRASQVAEQWSKGGLSASSAATYMSWVRRFREYCDRCDLDELAESCRAGLIRFLRQYSGRRKGRRISAATKACAGNAIHAWACALQVLGDPVPPWLPLLPMRRLPPLLEEFAVYRKQHRGVRASTVLREVNTAKDFLQLLRDDGRRVSRMRLVDVDEFVVRLSDSLSPRTVADSCSRLRGFLRFLHATKRINKDIALSVVAPRLLRAAKPPRALSPKNLRRIIRAIPRTTMIGRRDYAMLLAMASYGLGAAEILALRLDDIEWTAGILHVRRPKTGARVDLPLLPAVARSLAEYLRLGRPAGVDDREIFLRVGIPHRPISSGAIRHRVRLYAENSGVHAEVLGAHIFRHSHATAQIDAGVNLKVVGDILGHRLPASTSAYVRVAQRRLRLVGLPVPR